MGEFKDSSLWIKLAMLFTVLAFALDLYGMDTPGWSTAYWWQGCGSKHCDRGWYGAVEAFEVIAFITLLVAIVLILCLVLLDELKGNKIALICYVVFVLIGGICAVIGVAIYGGRTHGSLWFSTMITCMAGLCGILGGIFGILELAGVSA